MSRQMSFCYEAAVLCAWPVLSVFKMRVSFLAYILDSEARDLGRALSFVIRIEVSLLLPG